MKKTIVVADLFSDRFKGGAELTTDAIISYASPDTEVERQICGQLTPSYLKENQDAKWIIGNFFSLSNELKVLFCKTLDYDVVEYDYKFCRYRSPEKHFASENRECNCLSTTPGKVNTAFYAYAKRVWFMSQGQQEIFLSSIPHLKEENTKVLSSVFEAGDLRFIESIKDNPKNDKYIILESRSWIKGTPDCVAFAQSNNLPYEMVSGLPYHELLIKLSTSKGLIFLPKGMDTCPRIVIEAKLLGCDLVMNDYVQHKDEEWFTGSSEKAVSYLTNQMTDFWTRYE